MLTPERISEVIEDTLAGKDVNIVIVDHDDYMRRSKQHPFIQLQMRIGIYDADTIDEEFLSVACTYSRERTIEVDAVLLSNQMKGVDPSLAHAYVQNIALHEYHHIEHHHAPAKSEQEQLEREIECEAYLAKNYPDIVRAAAQAEAASPAIQRVYARMNRLRPN